MSTVNSLLAEFGGILDQHASAQRTVEVLEQRHAETIETVDAIMAEYRRILDQEAVEIMDQHAIALRAVAALERRLIVVTVGIENERERIRGCEAPEDNRSGVTG